MVVNPQEALLRTVNTTYLRLIRYFLHLGLIGFGGPPAHIAIMRADLVERRKWITPQQFESDLATANLLPGPTSTEMAVYIGYRLGGVLGAILSGACFIAPTLGIMLALAMVYVHLGTVLPLHDVLYGVKPMVLGVVIIGTASLGQPVLRSWREWALFFVVLGVLIFSSAGVLVILIGSGLALLMLSGQFKNKAAFALAALPAVTVSGLELVGQVFVKFLTIGVIAYGGGFALVGFLERELVSGAGWLTQEQLLDAVALSQSVPGPVFTVSAFIGYLVAGLPGAFAGLIGIFTPAFAVVLAERKLTAMLRDKPAVQTFLRGVVVGVTAMLTLSVASLGAAACVDPFTTLLAAATLLVLLRWKVAPYWVVLVGFAIGLIRFALT